jgi:hypothetical protein
MFAVEVTGECYERGKGKAPSNEKNDCILTTLAELEIEEHHVRRSHGRTSLELRQASRDLGFDVRAIERLDERAHLGVGGDHEDARSKDPYPGPQSFRVKVVHSRSPITGL